MFKTIWQQAKNVICKECENTLHLKCANLMNNNITIFIKVNQVFIANTVQNIDTQNVINMLMTVTKVSLVTNVIDGHAQVVSE